MPYLFIRRKILSHVAFPLGLIGIDTSYSLSPKIHRAAAEELGLSSSYEGFSLSEKQVNPFLDTFWAEGGFGLNITNPYKKMVAQLIGGCHSKPVNTLLRTDHGWQGFSTDGEGFFRALLRANQSLKSFSSIVFLGSGDVVESIFDSIGPRLSSQSVHILRRSERNDRKLLSCFPKCMFHSFASDSLQKVIKQSQGSVLLIQATSAPNQGNDLSFLAQGLEGFQGFFF